MPVHPRASLELLEHTPQLHKSLPGEHKPQEGHTRCSSSSLNKRSTITIPFKKNHSRSRRECKWCVKMTHDGDDDDDDDGDGGHGCDDDEKYQNINDSVHLR